MTFFENVLGLKVLRHEEFDEGCEATCNGPYGGTFAFAALTASEKSTVLRSAKSISLICALLCMQQALNHMWKE